MATPTGPALKPAAQSFETAAAYTGFSASHLRRLVARNELPHIRCGKAVRLLTADLDAFLVALRQPAGNVDGERLCQ